MKKLNFEGLPYKFFHEFVDGWRQKDMLGEVIPLTNDALSVISSHIATAEALFLNVYDWQTDLNTAYVGNECSCGPRRDRMHIFSFLSNIFVKCTALKIYSMSQTVPLQLLI
jgi:hypothetical protein